LRHPPRHPQKTVPVALLRALLAALLAVATLFAAACGGPLADDGSGDSSGDPLKAAAAPAGLTADFRAWLAASAYRGDDFPRDDLGGQGSFGGRTSAGQALAHDPVVFIHGNSDCALCTAISQTGWSASRDWFLAHGYSNAELYATTWGTANLFDTYKQAHSKANVLRTRRFLQAVLAYTGAKKLDVIGHSMGVTLARKAILGGQAYDEASGSYYDVGAPLTGSIDAFVGIAGANLGLVDCYLAGPTTATCGNGSGLYPGYLFWGSVVGRSTFLNDLLAHPGAEGAYRYSLLSTVDEVVGYGDVVYGSYTSSLPGQTAGFIYTSIPYGHIGLKDKTCDRQLRLVRDHKP
jgi:pimeloyl-ACP methyl ester carboxylesterase